MGVFKMCVVCGSSTNINRERLRIKAGMTKCYHLKHDYFYFVACIDCKTIISKSKSIDDKYCSDACKNHRIEILAKREKTRCISCGVVCGRLTCLKCEEEKLQKQRNEIREKHDIDVTAFDEYKNCNYGICDIVKAHHKILESDPERLTSEFIIKLVCGEEGKEFYLERRAERIK